MVKLIDIDAHKHQTHLSSFPFVDSVPSGGDLCTDHLVQPQVKICKVLSPAIFFPAPLAFLTSFSH
jgi:hypothetical protein